MVEELASTAVLPHLHTGWLGHAYHYYPTISSTNDVLKEMVRQGSDQWPPAGTVLVADYQSAGRGRLDRRWEASPGTSLMMSLLFRPDWPGQQLLWLTMMASLAVLEAAETAVGIHAAPMGVKWPNDLMIWQEGVWRKWGGLLLEGSVAENGRLQTVVMGLGLNVNMTTSQLPQGITPTASLSLAAGRPVSRLALLVDILTRLEGYYAAAEDGRSPQPQWQARLITLGQMVTVSRPGQPLLAGQAVGVDEWGQLLVQSADGRQHTIAAGDVSLRG
ncbi:MAG: biotin--[acetyl-CoA-carboxylase] ligase [Chloroflexi bacterium]|nr:biotin--[acetyl-CoA-carboxylase] ligase [Chloroflexota bacterium]